MHVANGQSLPLFWGFMPPKWGKRPELGGYIVRRKWHCGQICSVKCWSLCDEYCCRGAQIFPFSGRFWHPLGDVVPFGEHFVRLCLNFGQSGTNTMAGIRKFPIFGAFSPLLTLFPLEFMENLLWRNFSHGPLPLCQISSLCDKRFRRNASLSPTYLRMYVPTYKRTNVLHNLYQ